MPFGTYLHQQRVAHGQRRTEFAEQLGVSPAHLLDLELNHALPSYTELQRLGALLHLPAVELLSQAGYLHGATGAQ